jgi:hypothetical protein
MDKQMLSENEQFHFDMFYAFWTLIDYYKLLFTSKEAIEDLEYENTSKRLSASPEYFEASDIRSYFEHEFIELTTTSGIINLQNRIDVYLRRLCKKYKDDRKLPIGYNELTGSATEKAKAFFKL